MLPKNHIIIGLILSLLIYLIFPQIGILAAGVIFLSSFLIDVDHYLYYAIKYHDWNLKNAYNWFIHKSKIWNKLTPHQRKDYERAVIIFHGAECIFILMLLVILNKIFLFILIGFIIHLLLDFIDILNRNEPIYIKSSQILVMHRNKNKKKRL